MSLAPFWWAIRAARNHSQTGAEFLRVRNERATGYVTRVLLSERLVDVAEREVVREHPVEGKALDVLGNEVECILQICRS